jgi:hypothetical protein
MMMEKEWPQESEELFLNGKANLDKLLKRRIEKYNSEIQRFENANKSLRENDDQYDLEVMMDIDDNQKLIEDWKFESSKDKNLLDLLTNEQFAG